MVYICMLSCSVVSYSLRHHSLQPVRLLGPWEFSRQEYWSGLPYPPPGDLPNQGSKSGLPHCGRILYSLSPREAQEYWVAYPFSRGSSFLHCRRILYQLELPGKSHMLVDTHIKSQCIILLISGVLISPAART